jgi:hypothetical protein
MAKNKRSIWDIPQDEVVQAAKQVQQESIHHIPEREEEQVAVVEPNIAAEPLAALETPKIEKPEKLQIIYVDTAHHTQAKINAAMRGMKLGKYVEYLINEDKNNL